MQLSSKINKMKLKDIPINNSIDQFYFNTATVAYTQTHGENRDGVTTKLVLLEGGKMILVKTRGVEESILYAVFVPKIRRESEGLFEAPIERKRAWYEMAKQFVVEFGEERTPPDIVKCLQQVKEHENF